ncbi:UDP-N-acetylenolpyruvoylglucosamine reductase [Hydrogenimonas sp.]|nr:UDP-N-acetylenolpyruvoylglucosamine reductase [Hydrogenimonas sp.]
MKSRRVDFSKFSSIKIGPVADVLVLEKGDEIPGGRMLIGHANNLLVSPAPPPLMMLGKDFDYIRPEERGLAIGAATPTGKILSFCKKHDIGGFEYLAKLPGTLGGALAMNAGVKSYETFNRLIEVTTDKGRFEKERIEHGYRFANLPGVALEALFKTESGFDSALAEDLLRLRRGQPVEPSAGSAFKNPPGDYAGRLIEAVGLKGRRVGDMAWSAQHANFLVNLGNGSFDEAMTLIEMARSEVRKRFGIDLQLELKIV